MKDLPTLPRSELEVAQIVWRLENATVRQVMDELPKNRALDFWTVQTYLRRLAKKGFLKCRKDGRNNVYSPAIEPERVIRGFFEETIQRLFGGDPLPAFQHLIEDPKLSDRELDHLRSALEELRSQRRKKRG